MGLQRRGAGLWGRGAGWAGPGCSALKPSLGLRWRQRQERGLDRQESLLPWDGANWAPPPNWAGRPPLPPPVWQLHLFRADGPQVERGGGTCLGGGAGRLPGAGGGQTSDAPTLCCELLSTTPQITQTVALPSGGETCSCRSRSDGQKSRIPTPTPDQKAASVSPPEARETEES